MINLRKQAELEARLYDGSFQIAQEDFMAGYLKGVKAAEDRLRFAAQMMGKIKLISEEQDERYSLEIATYALDKLK